LFTWPEIWKSLVPFVLLAAEALEPGGAAAEDRRHDRDALDVVDRGRAAIEAGAAGNGGFRRGKPFLPSRLLSIAVSSPQI
jgi:hypothetical protein